MQGALSNPTRWAGTRQGSKGRWKKASVWRDSVNCHCATCQAQRNKIHPRNQPGGTRSGGPTGAHGGRGSEASTVPLAPRAVTSPPGLPRHSRRPHARTSPTSRGRLPWRQAASPEAALNGCRSQSTTPRRGTSSPPAAPGSPATPPVSREAGGRERARGRGRRKGGAANGGGHLCAASGGVAAIVLRRRLLCCPRGLRPSTPGEEEEEAVWLRWAPRSLRCASWKRVKSGGSGGGGEHWRALPPPPPPNPGPWERGRADGACPSGTRGGLWRRAAGVRDRAW